MERVASNHCYGTHVLRPLSLDYRRWLCETNDTYVVHELHEEGHVVAAPVPLVLEVDV